MNNRQGRMWWRRLSGLATALVWSSAWAASYVPLGSTITTYSVYSSGAVIVFAPAQPGIEGCSYQPGNELWIDFALPEGKTLYATFIAAYTAGQKVGFGVSGCGDAGQLPSVYRVDVQ